jgi:DnaJ-class molecular chaperone
MSQDNTCDTCRGTGEGIFEFDRCSVCKGKGYILDNDDDMTEPMNPPDDPPNNWEP